MSDRFGNYTINDGSITITLGKYNKNCTPDCLDLLAQNFLSLASDAQGYSEKYSDDELAYEQAEIIRAYLDNLPEFDRWEHGYY